MLLQPSTLLFYCLKTYNFELRLGSLSGGCIWIEGRLDSLSEPGGIHLPLSRTRPWILIDDERACGDDFREDLLCAEARRREIFQNRRKVLVSVWEAKGDEYRDSKGGGGGMKVVRRPDSEEGRDRNGYSRTVTEVKRNHKDE